MSLYEELYPEELAIINFITRLNHHERVALGFDLSLHSQLAAYAELWTECKNDVEPSGDMENTILGLVKWLLDRRLTALATGRHTDEAGSVHSLGDDSVQPSNPLDKKLLALDFIEYQCELDTNSIWLALTTLGKAYGALNDFWKHGMSHEHIGKAMFDALYNRPPVWLSNDEMAVTP